MSKNKVVREFVDEELLKLWWEQFTYGRVPSIEVVIDEGTLDEDWSPEKTWW